jgi:hypothetical protein
MPRTFLIITERKRVKFRITYYIGEIIDGKVKLLNNDLQVPTGSNRGLVNEALNHLIKIGELDSKFVDKGGYKEDPDKELNIIHVETTELAYIGFY